MLDKLSNFGFRVLGPLERSLDPSQKKHKGKSSRNPRKNLLSPPEQDPKFWIENDETKYLRPGESFSLTVKRDIPSESPKNYVKIRIYKVPSHEESLLSTSLINSWPGLLLGNRLLFWNESLSLAFDYLRIQVPGDFRIRVTALEYRGDMVGYAIAADIYSEIIHQE
ncbi:hypothetical protein Daesc_009396 [Daldinia eschscholtzii]|uniref:Uncharacterized protein n=1 Tax=Daldinia eschscholtzii TaxID=292717 RepID=A0AAX6MAV2_9PEZI